MTFNEWTHTEEGQKAADYAIKGMWAQAIQIAYDAAHRAPGDAPDPHYPTPNQIKWLRDANEAGYDPVLTVQVLRDKVMFLERQLSEAKSAQGDAGGMTALRERLAELCHSQWSGWMRYMFSRMDWNIIQTGMVMHGDDAKRWKRQMETTYAELSESEKNSDRTEADKFIALISATPAPAPAQTSVDLSITEELYDWMSEAVNYIPKQDRPGVIARLKEIKATLAALRAQEG